jgi:hypothetical protein
MAGKAWQVKVHIMAVRKERKGMQEGTRARKSP